MVKQELYIWKKIKDFFSGFFSQLQSCVYKCDDPLSYNYSPRSSHTWFSYIHNFIIILSRFYNEPTQRPAPGWLVSSIGSALHRYRREPYKPEFFSVFPSLKTSKTCLPPSLLNSACLLGSLGEKGWFRSANILQIADVVHWGVFLLFLLYVFRQ